MKRGYSSSILPILSGAVERMRIERTHKDTDLLVRKSEILDYDFFAWMSPIIFCYRDGNCHSKKGVLAFFTYLSSINRRKIVFVCRREVVALCAWA